jgi:hypothetical protein
MIEDTYPPCRDGVGALSSQPTTSSAAAIGGYGSRRKALAKAMTNGEKEGVVWIHFFVQQQRHELSL